MSDGISADARLYILQELARQTDARSNDMMLSRMLDSFGVRRSRDWVRTQLAALAELEAIRVEPAGEIMIATLRANGRDHVERRCTIAGVARPADER